MKGSSSLLLGTQSMLRSDFASKHSQQKYSCLSLTVVVEQLSVRAEIRMWPLIFNLMMLLRHEHRALHYEPEEVRHMKCNLASGHRTASASNQVLRRGYF